jgi:hypothetical protein
MSHGVLTRRPPDQPGHQEPGPYRRPDPRAVPGQASRAAVPGRRGEAWAPARMTPRGAVLAMFSLFFPGTLTAGWLHFGALTSLSFLAGCVLAARYTRRDGLLTAVVSPPLVFMVALICSEALTSHGGTFAHTVTIATEGTFLTLAAVAPWLFLGVILGIVIAMFRGLPQCVRELRAELRGEGRPEPQAAHRRPGRAAR